MGSSKSGMQLEKATRYDLGANRGSRTNIVRLGSGGGLLERRRGDRRSARGPEAWDVGLGCRFVSSGVEFTARACSPQG